VQVQVRRRQLLTIIFIILQHQLGVMPLLKLEPIILGLTITHLQRRQHQLMGLLQQSELRYQRLVLLQVLIQQLAEQFFPLRFKWLLNLQVQRLQELEVQFLHRLVRILLQLGPMILMLNSKLEINA